jgi:hypothetical protein
MPINPLELQTNFMQITQVGKLQSSLKEVEEIKENQINTMIQKEGDKEAEDIPVTKDISEGLGKIKDKEKKNNLKNRAKKNQEVDEDIEEEIENKEEPDLKNPIIGQKIDIVG